MPAAQRRARQFGSRTQKRLSRAGMATKRKGERAAEQAKQAAKIERITHAQSKDRRAYFCILTRQISEQDTSTPLCSCENKAFATAQAVSLRAVPSMWLPDKPLPDKKLHMLGNRQWLGKTCVSTSSDISYCQAWNSAHLLPETNPLNPLTPLTCTSTGTFLQSHRIRSSASAALNHSDLPRFLTASSPCGAGGPHITGPPFGTAWVRSAHTAAAFRRKEMTLLTTATSKGHNATGVRIV